MAVKQRECSKFEQRSFIKRLLAEKCKWFEIYWRKCNVCGEADFSKKEFINGLNMVFHCVVKTVHGMETHWFSHLVSKRGHAESVLKH